MVLKKHLMLCTAVMAVTAAQPVSAAPWTRGFVVSAYEYAFRYGGRPDFSRGTEVEPGVDCPHAGDEELHLLDGELWIDEHKLFPGDYNYGAPGAGDDRVWSETGCTCVLVTSTKDTLR